MEVRANLVGLNVTVFIHVWCFCNDLRNYEVIFFRCINTMRALLKKIKEMCIGMYCHTVLC